MHTFKDNASRTWTLAIHVSAIKRVKGLLGIDLYGLIDAEFDGLAKLLGNPCDLVDVLFCLCKEEADKMGVTDEEFGRGMGGDSLERATDAFLEELTDFFPDPRKRAGLRKVLEKGKTVTSLALDHAMATLDAIDVESEARRLIASSGRLRASSESTPDLSRSAN